MLTLQKKEQHTLKATGKEQGGEAFLSLFFLYLIRGGNEDIHIQRRMISEKGKGQRKETQRASSLLKVRGLRGSLF